MITQSLKRRVWNTIDVRIWIRDVGIGSAEVDELGRHVLMLVRSLTMGPGAAMAVSRESINATAAVHANTNIAPPTRRHVIQVSARPPTHESRLVLWTLLVGLRW